MNCVYCTKNASLTTLACKKKKCPTDDKTIKLNKQCGMWVSGGRRRRLNENYWTRIRKERVRYVVMISTAGDLSRWRKGTRVPCGLALTQRKLPASPRRWGRFGGENLDKCAVDCCVHVGGSPCGWMKNIEWDTNEVRVRCVSVIAAASERTQRRVERYTPDGMSVSWQRREKRQRLGVTQRKGPASPRWWGGAFGGAESRQGWRRRLRARRR